MIVAAGVVDEFLEALVQGIPVGAVFALIAIGFVLAYKTSGVFNLAFGAQAFVSAAAYFELHVRREWPIWSSLLLAVVVLAPVIGLLFEYFVFRHLRGASPVARLVASLGLLIAVPELFMIIIDFNREPSFGAVGIVPDGTTVYQLFGSYPITRDELVQLAVAVAGGLGLALLFRSTRLGLQMRAVVESPRMTELRGVDAERVSAVAWVISSLFAGMAGVLLAPRFVTIQPSAYFQLVVIAIAAAAIGRLVSLPWALAGGLLLGVLDTELTAFVDSGSLIGQNLGPSLPFLVLFGVIVGVPAIRRSVQVTDPLSGVDPPPPSTQVGGRDPSVVWGFRLAGIAVLVGGFAWAMTAADAFWLILITEAVIFSVIYLSVTVFTGLGGQVSLALASFAAVGAFTTSQLAENFEVSVIGGALLGAALAGALGMLLALPVMRLGGIWLALATLAFALFFDSVIVKLSWVGGATLQGGSVPRPVLGPLDFADDQSFLVLCVVALAVVGSLVVLVQRGSTGRFLQAVRGDEAAAESIGIVPARVRLVAFGLSAGIAGLGGALLAMRQGSVNYSANFTPFVGLFWVLIVVVISARSVSAAVNAGIAFKLFPELALGRGLGVSGAWLFVLFGLGAVTYVRHPEGIFDYQVRRTQQILSSWLARFRRQPRAAAVGEGATS